MTTTVTAIDIGQEVHVGSDGEQFTGHVTAVCVREKGMNKSIQYEITYWSGKDLKSVWLHDYLVSQTKNNSKRVIGFVSKES